MQNLASVNLFFFFVSLFNTYYLLSNENPLFVILSLVACVLLFFAEFYSLLFTFTLFYCSPSLLVIFLSLFDIFDSFSFFIHFHLFHFTYFYVYSVICCWFTCFKIVHHRLLLLYLQKYSLTLIIESSRFLMSRLHGCSRYLAPYKLVFLLLCFLFIYL
uniref:(northern house mosquito) hypothetical protein n=1 Tax=Culex pipiens TaxID=7175 RepID=A0A8D8H9A1_CULPI